MPKALLRMGLCVAGAIALRLGAIAQQETPPPLDGQTPPAPSPSAAVTPQPAKPLKPTKPPHAKAPNPNRPVSKEIPFPLPIGELAKLVKIPQTGLSGELLSQLMAAQIKRLDEDHVEMETMNIDLYQPDGKTDFHITVPTSVFNLKTRIIHSDFPVTIKTQDFELTGEKMEFDTVERSGKLIGKVRMMVHNLKKVAGQTDETKTP